LTKKFEEIHRGTVVEAINHFRKNAPRGEFTIVIGQAPSDAKEQAPYSPDDIDSALRAALNRGFSSKDAVEFVATSLAAPRNLVYKSLLEIRRAIHPDSKLK
jgi:16S rRNA (cytidine1402-2'-O)-methyltransferase